MTEELIITRENYITLLSLLNSTDKENQELYSSFYKKICIKENALYLLLLVKESRHGIEHFRKNYPDMFSCLPSINADMSKINFYTFGTIQEYIKFPFIPAEAVHFFVEEYCRHFIRDIVAPLNQEPDEINVTYKSSNKGDISTPYKGISV